jgi:Domain of unknown function (DUF4157)
MYRRDADHAPKHGHAHDSSHAGTSVAPGPGKQTQVERLEAGAGYAGAGLVQRKGAGPVAGASPGAALPADGGGAAMPAEVQRKMEQVFGTSLAAVRIHVGPRAAALGAKAYTQGTEIHFAPGTYQPESPAGQTLLGHELAHVIQQSAGRVSATSEAHGVPVNEDAGLEAEADEMGAKAARGESVGSSVGAAVHSLPEGQPIQRVQIPGEYRLTSSANLRAKAEPYDAIEELPEDAMVTVPVHAEELAFRLNILSRDHTYVTYRGTDQRTRRGWVKDSVLEVATRNERGVGTMHFDRQTAVARARVDDAVAHHGEPVQAREKQAFHQLTQIMKPRIMKWIPPGIDTSNLYAFVAALNHNLLQDVVYTRVYSSPERCVSTLRGDCRSICELNKYILETVLGVQGVEIESAKNGVRVAGSTTPDQAYTNHHWLKIGGQRLDAMEDRAFSFASWEVHRNHAWRTMAAGDVIQGISINEL